MSVDKHAKFAPPPDRDSWKEVLERRRVDPRTTLLGAAESRLAIGRKPENCFTTTISAFCVAVCMRGLSASLLGQLLHGKWKLQVAWCAESGSLTGSERSVSSGKPFGAQSVGLGEPADCSQNAQISLVELEKSLC